MGNSDSDSARQQFEHLVNGLYQREATGRGVIAIELSPELIAATIEGGAQQQQEAEVSEVRLAFYLDAAVFSARIKVKGKAWPPRPPVDTKISFSARQITHSEAGKSGAVMFRVEEPLKFSSKFADVLAGMAGKLFKNMPISLDALRHKDSLITIDFAEMITRMRPDMTSSVAQVRLFNLKVTDGRVRVEFGFLK